MPKSAWTLALATVGFLGTAAGDSPTPASQTFGRANPHKISAYVVLLRLRTDIYLKWKTTGKWPSDPTVDEALDGHSQYWEQQLKAGRALLAGAMGGDYWDNAALVVFEAESLDQAQQIAQADPAVKAFAFQAQVRPFDVFWLTNRYTVIGHPADGARVQ
jgi:uncharacterized protein YciI